MPIKKPPGLSPRAAFAYSDFHFCMYCMTIAVTTAAMIGLSTTLKNSHMRRIFFSRTSASSISMRVRSSLRIRSSSNLFIKPSRRAMRSSMFIGTILLLIHVRKEQKSRPVRSRAAFAIWSSCLSPHHQARSDRAWSPRHSQGASQATRKVS